NLPPPMQPVHCQEVCTPTNNATKHPNQQCNQATTLQPASLPQVMQPTNNTPSSPTTLTKKENTRSRQQLIWSTEKNVGRETPLSN
ncbi:hypothetical protein VIGAN_01168700, partial [Vigna angularis var. angularis]